jgi:predicted nucleotidyltransferase
MKVREKRFRGRNDRSKVPPSVEEIEKAVTAVCAADTRIVAAWLFGSIVCGTPGPGSDVDLAILLAPDAENFSLPSFIVSLEKVLDWSVDVVVLNRAGELLKYEVRRNGRLLWDRSPETRIRFEVMGRKYFEDFRHIHNRYTRQVLYGGRDGESRDP